MAGAALFAALDPENVMLTVIKKAEDGGALILRLYEFTGPAARARIRLPAPAAPVVETNLMELPEPVAAHGPGYPRMADRWRWRRDRIKSAPSTWRRGASGGRWTAQ